MHQFTGTGIALITPFKKDFSVDVDALTKIVHHVIDGGVSYLVVLGTTGEPATLNKEEKKLVIDTVIIANNNRLPIVIGIGGNSTQQVIEEIQNTDLSNFSAILSVSPYYNKPTQDGIYEHFKAIAQVAPIPLILYNVPSRTGSNMLPETVVKLAQDFSNIIAIKEAAGDMVQALTLFQKKPKNFMIISGDDMIALPMVLAGGSGVISVIGQAFPDEFSKMIALGLARKTDEAYQIQYKLMDSINMIFEQGNPAGVKEIFKILNISENTVRLPLVSVNENLSERLKIFIKNQ
jgi:4-hydroxy-tetrahydrodipicolinate synthase